MFQGTLMCRAVFGKIVWRNVDQQGGANTERKLMENQLFHAVKDKRTPCMPVNLKASAETTHLQRWFRRLVVEASAARRIQPALCFPIG